MQVILVTDKWGTQLIDATDLPEAALKLLERRMDEGYWYDNENDGNPLHQYADRARDILLRAKPESNEDRSKVGMLAWRFLKMRSDKGFEYEDVELREVD
jgi:hypothetical protein